MASVFRPEPRTALTVALSCIERSQIPLGAGYQKAMLNHSNTYSIQLTSGTDANESDLVFSTLLAVQTGSPQTYDLTALVSQLDDGACNFAEITGLIVENLSETPGEFIVLGGGSSPFSSMWGTADDQVVIGPRGILVLFSPIDGYAVTGNTADNLRIATQSVAVGARIFILGRST